MEDTQLMSITKPDTTELEETGHHLLNQAQGLVINKDEDLYSADMLLSALADKVETFKPGLDKKCDDAFGVHRFLTGLRTKVMGPYVNAEKTVKQKMADYHFAKQERIRKENERLAAEAAKKAQALRDAEIAKAKAARDKELVEQLKTAPLPMPELKRPPAQMETPKLDNASFRDAGYDFIINDESQIPRKYLSPDIKKIAAAVKALGKDADIPGISIFQKPPTVVRR